MAYKATTQQGGYLAFQKEALHHIEKISRFWGIDLNPSKHWEDYGHNVYGKHHERDTINFRDFKILRINEVDGTAVPTNLKPKWATIQPLQNDTADPLNFEESFTENTTETKTDETSSLTGWSFESSQKIGVKVGGDAYGGSVEAEVSTTEGVHGESSRRHQTDKQDSDSRTVTVSGTIPPHTTYYVQQRQDKAVIEVPTIQYIILDLAFEVDDWKELRHDKDRSLWGNSRRHSLHPHSGDSHRRHTYAMLSVKSEQDFLEIASGVSPDFPHQRTDHTKTHSPIHEHVKWLLDPMNRAIEVHLTEKYENGTSGHTRVVDHADKEITEAFPNGN